MRLLLYLLWSLLSLLVIVLVSVTILLTVFNQDVEDKLVGGLERISQRNIDVQGGFGFRFNPRPTFIAKDIRMANADWGNQPWMLEVDSMQASLSISSLLKGKVSLSSIKASNPKVLVEQDPVSGAINWIFPITREPQPLVWLAENLEIQLAEIVGTEVKIEVGTIDHFLDLKQVTGRTNSFSQLVDIQALGSLDNSALELNFKLDNLRKMFLRLPTPIEFNGLHGATRIKGKGVIAQLLRWRALDIELDLEAPSLMDVQSWVATRLIETPKLRASARFVQPVKWDSARLDDIVVKSDAIDGRTDIAGHVTQLRGMNGIHLNGEMSYPLASIMQWKGLESASDILIDAKVSLSGNRDEGLLFNVESANFTGEGVEIKGQGAVVNLLASTTAGIPFKGHIDSVSTLGLINARSWFNSEKLTGGFEIMKKEGRLALDKIKVSSFDGRARLEGMLDDITRDQIGLFALDANFNQSDVRQFNELNELKLTAFENTDVQAKIAMNRSEFSAHDVNFIARSPGLSIHAKGDIQVLQNLQINGVSLALEADSVKHVNAQFATNFPELGKLKGTATADGNINNHYNINDIEFNMDNAYQSITATGSLRELGATMKGKLATQVEIRSLKNIPPLLGSSLEVPDKSPGKGDATLIANSADDWTFEDINVMFDGRSQGKIGGSVSHFPKLADYALIADFSRIDPADLPSSSILDDLAPENIRAYTKITSKQGENVFSFSQIDSNFSLSSGVASVNIAGEVADISNFKGLLLSVGLSTSDAQRVPYLTSLSLKKGLSGTASLILKGHPDKLAITVSSVKLADSDMRGKLNLLSSSRTKPILTGSLTSGNLDWHALLAQEKRKQLFSEELLNLDWLNDIDINLQLEAERFSGVISQLNDAKIAISVNNGVLNMPNMNGRIENGSFAAWLTVVAQNRPYNIVTSLKVQNVKPEHINLFGDSGFIRNGEIDIDIGLGGSGNSIADFIGNSYGKIQLQLKDSSIRHRNLKLFGADLISGIFDIIDTLSQKTIYLPIECGVIHFPVINGKALASQGIAIKTDKITVLGGGIIDLETEGLDLLISPKPRKGLGVNAGTVTNIVKVSGSINEPRIAVDKSGLIQTSATIGAAIASSGWTLLLQGLYAKNKANSDVCGQTLADPDQAQFKIKEQKLESDLREK